MNQNDKVILEYESNEKPDLYRETSSGYSSTQSSNKKKVDNNKSRDSLV